MSVENGSECLRQYMKIVTSGWEDVPRLAETVFEEAVNLGNVASCFVVS